MQKTKAQITTWGLIMIVLGSTIGSGIFSTPSVIASQVPSSTWIYFVWIMGGFISLSGAIIFAKLAREFSGSGGIYLYLKNAYGNLIAFLYGWCTLTVITSGAVAAITLVSVDYINSFYPLSHIQSLFLGSLIILFHGIIHSLGIKVGEIFIHALTGSKFLGLLAIIVSGLFFLPESTAEISILATDFTPSIGSLSIALVAVLWSFSGFQHVSFLAGESASDGKPIAKAMIIGTTLVTLIYLLINFVLIRVLGITDLMHTTKPVADALSIGSIYAGKLVSLLVIISTFGAGFVFTMSAPRIYEQMGKDGVFFNFLAKRNTRFGSPSNAILTQTFWSIFLLCFWGTFKALITYSTFLDWIFLGLAGFSILFYIRKKSISPIYRFASILFTIAVFFFLIVVLMEGPAQAYYGIGLLLIGCVVYFVFKTYKKKSIPINNYRDGL